MTEKQLRKKYVAAAESFHGTMRGDAKHKQIIDTYNSIVPHPRGYEMTYTAPWCAPFVSAVAVLCDMLQIYAFECSCTKQIEMWKTMGRWIEDDAYVPTMGDLIYYDWDDGPDYASTDAKTNVDHVGIVVSCDGKSIKVIEGNMGSLSGVGYRMVDVNGRYIRGFAVPDYAGMADKLEFSDIEYSHYRADIEWAKEMGIASGYSDGTFRPGDPITRGMMCAFLRRYDKVKEGK